MPQDRDSASDDDDHYTEADRNRISELFPRDLTAVFAPSPEAPARTAPHDQPLAVAGSENRTDISLERMQVVMRIRPPLNQGIPSWSKENCIHAVSGSTVAIAPPESSQGYKNGDRGQTYNFTRVFNCQTSQEAYFQATAAPLVRHLVQEQQAESVLMAYGISAAGKTYTIEGTRSEPGLLPRALDLLFQELKESPEMLHVRVSQFEVYNEQIYDLLIEETGAVLGPRPALRLKEDSQARIFVKDLSEVAVSSASAAMDVQRRGARQRQKAATALNYHSSRSHSIFTVSLYRAGAAQASVRDHSRVGRLSFVDLAGSERANRTGNVGARLKESVAINASLMTLGRCLEALRWNQQHRAADPKLVPYRESKVTHLFRDVLHGWGQILLSVNVSPCAKDYDETAHVLKYAAVATQIGTAARAEAPVRALKAISPNITKKRLPKPEPINLKPAKKQKIEAPPVLEQTDQVSTSDAAELPAGHAVEQEHSGYFSSEDTDAEQTDAVIPRLEEDISRLHEQLVAAEERCALAETEIRAEVSAEMASLLHDMEANYKERLASEVAAMDKPRSNGGRSGQRATAEVLSTHTQTDPGDSSGQLDIRAEELLAFKSELQALHATLAAKDEQLGAHNVQMTALRLDFLSKLPYSEEAAAAHSELKAAHAELLSSSQAAYADHAQEESIWCQEVASLRQQLDTSEQLTAQQAEQIQSLNGKLHRKGLKLMDARESSKLAFWQEEAAERVQAEQQMRMAAQVHISTSALAELQQMHDSKTAEWQTSHATLQQQLDESIAKQSQLDQGLAELNQMATDCVMQCGLSQPALMPDSVTSPRTRVAKVIAVLGDWAQGAEAAAEQLQQQLQESDLAHEDQIHQLRVELQQAQMRDQHMQPKDAQVLRQSLERELKQQVTQLEANSQMEVEMLQQQLDAVKKEKTALQRRLEAATAAMASANISAANPALLRVMQGGTKGGAQRGAGGTPHALALAWAREEAARLSPALQLATASKTPHPGLLHRAGPQQPLLFPNSPHLNMATIAEEPSAVKSNKFGQQQAISHDEPATAAGPAAVVSHAEAVWEADVPASTAVADESAVATNQSEAAWEVDSPTFAAAVGDSPHHIQPDLLSAAQAASRLSLLQAEQAQTELELANSPQLQTHVQMPHTGNAQQLQRSAPSAAQGISAGIIAEADCDMLMQRHCQHSAGTGPNAANARGSRDGPANDSAQLPVQQGTQVSTSHSAPVQMTQQPAKTSSRQTRSSSRASLAAVALGAEVSSNAHKQRTKTQTHALATVAEQAEASPSASAEGLNMLEDMHVLQQTEDAAENAIAPAISVPVASNGFTQPDLADPSRPHDQPLCDEEHPSVQQQHVTEFQSESSEQPQACQSLPYTRCSRESEPTVDVTNQQDLAGCSNQLPDNTAGMADVLVHASGPAAATASASDAPLTVAPAAVDADIEGPVLSKERQNQCELVEGESRQEAQQAQQQRAKAKRPPKAKQPAKKKQTRKGGRAVAEPDENASMNTEPLGTDRQCAELSSIVAADNAAAVADPEDVVQCEPAAAEAVAQDAGQQQREAAKPKRRKLQPPTPMSRSVQEALGEFVADDSHFRQHMKQTPVALRTRRATRFGGL